MGLTYTNLQLSNPYEPSANAIEVDNVLVDTGALHLCIPESLFVQLNLPKIEERAVQMADARTKIVPYVGPIKVKFGNRSCVVGALVLGDEVLLGAIPMEDMDLVVNPANRKVTVNPKYPNIPVSIAKGICSVGRS